MNEISLSLFCHRCFSGTGLGSTTLKVQHSADEHELQQWIAQRGAGKTEGGKSTKVNEKRKSGVEPMRGF